MFSSTCGREARVRIKKCCWKRSKRRISGTRLGKLRFPRGLSILIGDNGQGKTNFLEAIAVLATTRSFRTAKLQETIRFDEGTAIIVGDVRISGEIARELRAVIQERVKQFAVNGKRESLQRYLGQLHAVVFTSDELAVIRGGPEFRRRFLDEAITAVHPPYAGTISEFARVIKQKNALLQNSRDSEYSVEKTAALLEPWNEQLAVLSTKIHRSRVRIVERLNEMLERRLFGTEEVRIRYASSLEGKGDLGDYERSITERLKTRVQAELVAGYSLIGTHRDDLEVMFDGRDLRKYGSAGQQRSTPSPSSVGEHRRLSFHSKRVSAVLDRRHRLRAGLQAHRTVARISDWKNADDRDDDKGKFCVGIRPWSRHISDL